jgi:hypothetical protein
MARRPIRKPDSEGIVTKALKVQREYAEWLERLASHDRRSVASLLDNAVSRDAAQIGFTEAPPERTP